jgi:hypothetical protein
MGSVMTNSDFFVPTFVVGVPRSGTTLLVTLLQNIRFCRRSTKPSF